MKQSPSTKKLIAELNVAAQSYKCLTGKQYLLIYDGNYIEVTFGKKHFKHLTGIGSKLNARAFFDDAFDGKIRSGQISFDNAHPYRLCRKKLKYIINLENSLCSDLLVLHEINTKTYIIPKGLTNFDYVLGLDVNDNIHGKVLNNNLVPYTLRVDDSLAFSNSKHQYQVDYIFSKSTGEKLYSKLCFGNLNNFDKLHESIKKLIDSDRIEPYNI